MKYTIEVDVERVTAAQMCETWDIPQLVRPGYSVIARCKDIILVLPEALLQSGTPTGVVEDVDYGAIKAGVGEEEPKRKRTR